MVEDSDIVKELEKREVVEFDDITTENVVKLPDERGGDFEDLVRIAKEYTSDRNIYKFGRSGLSHSSKFWRAVSKACCDSPVTSTTGRLPVSCLT